MSAFVPTIAPAFVRPSSRSPLVSTHPPHRTVQRHAAPATMVTSPPSSDVDDKAVVTEYFNNKGFDRWKRIYSEDGTVNKVQLDIRDGHAQTIDKLLAWLDADGPSLSGETFCDAGCGVGSLTLPLLQRGATVDASDISKAMADEASRRVAETLPAEQAAKGKFSVLDLEQVSGSYDTVCCIDVMIHYPSELAGEMIQKLAGCSKKRLIISFAPKTFLLSLLKKVGELFPGPSKATRAYLHSEADIIKAIEKAGLKVKRTEFTGTRFYFSKLIEAVKE